MDGSVSARLARRIERDFGEAAHTALAVLATRDAPPDPAEDEAVTATAVLAAAGDLEALAVAVAADGRTSDRLLDLHLGPQELFTATLPGRWQLIPPDKQAAMERQLAREVTPGHRAHGFAAVAHAWCASCDDTFYVLDTDPLRYVVVHLAYSPITETLPWPISWELTPPFAKAFAEFYHY
ncbi:hypothetical protein [Catellatospora chokoriensis]|uniref:Uncharacterized protein n=1 Tax=Catellatospora chokoriensis TaxID=310353 RepID=A0A8J3K1A4_9ACTN|nr:hypothetical protein [Catellatospora chokoriensis]GIF88875.1 hypothetical protein Cch02nite_23190 [Catellatospora chokoriensis]